jgi:hypothetical protein
VDGGKWWGGRGAGQGIPVPGDGPGVANRAEAGCSRRETRWATGIREMGEKVGQERKMGGGGIGRLQRIDPKALEGYKIFFLFQNIL